MELNIKERAILFGIIPQQSDYRTLLEIKKLIEDMRFTKEEVTKFGIEGIDIGNGQQQIKFNPDLSHETKEIPFGPRAMAAIVKRFKEIEKQSQLSLELLPLYEKFVR